MAHEDAALVCDKDADMESDTLLSTPSFLFTSSMSLWKSHYLYLWIWSFYS